MLGKPTGSPFYSRSKEHFQSFKYGNNNNNSKFSRLTENRYAMTLATKSWTRVLHVTKKVGHMLYKIQYLFGNSKKQPDRRWKHHKKQPIFLKDSQTVS